MDIRGGKFFDELMESLDFLDQEKIQGEILFLEANDETLIRRFKETRRLHPLSPDGRIPEGILKERRRLAEIRGRADKIIDSTNLSTQELKARLRELYDVGADRRLPVTVMSFGFKYGVPQDADLVLDVRFLPNPYYLAHLKDLTGEEDMVKEYVLDSPVTVHFLRRLMSLLTFLLPYYIQEGKSHLVIAIGCTGGHHRSVALARKVAQDLGQEKGDICRPSVKHRDLHFPAITPGEE
jgi:UPF0042 nucleotide-binding protein